MCYAGMCVALILKIDREKSELKLMKVNVISSVSKRLNVRILIGD
jgi:hypothetical protein